MAQFKTLYVNGCSWTAGDGVEQDDIFKEMFPGASYSQVRNDHINISDYTWGKFLAEKLEIQNFINAATGGGSNDRIFRTTLKFISDLPEDSRCDTLVVIGWTSFERSEVYLGNDAGSDDGWHRMNFNQPFGTYHNTFSKSRLKALNKYHELYVSEIYNDAAGFQKFACQVFSLKNVLENLGIKYLFFASLSGGAFEPHMRSSDFYDAIDGFLPMLQGPHILDLNFSYSAFAHINNLPISGCIHPLIKTNKVWADHLIQQLKTRGTIKEHY